MRNVQRIANFQTFLPLFLPEALEREYKDFRTSDLGKIHQAIPWKEIAKQFGLKQNRKGPLSVFPPEGKVALMFLKAYSQTSDKLLLEQLDANIHWQFFCGIRLQAGKKLRNFKIVSQIRCELAKELNIEKLQQSLAQYWSPHIKSTNKMLVDSTCYESEIRYPTDPKLLWEGVSFLYKSLKKRCRSLGIKLPRTKYRDWKSRYAVYNRMRRKPGIAHRTLKRGLLHLLKKLDVALDIIEAQHPVERTATYQKRRVTIKKAYCQQLEMLSTPSRSCAHRIVSLFKPHVRPIVRGKESRKYEFGAKVNKIQMDGISFIQRLSFEAFSDQVTFQESIALGSKLMGVAVTQVGADAGYASNANRKFATASGIQTDFVRKGRAGKEDKKRKRLAFSLRKERASRLEGSFGNEKTHYSLARVRARTKATEILWIFFGIHTANALQMGRRMQAARLWKVA